VSGVSSRLNKQPVKSKKKLRRFYAVSYELSRRFVLVLVLVLEAFAPLSIEYEDEYDDEHDLNTLFWR